MTQDVITQLTRLIAEHYVFPEVAEDVNRELRRRLTAGAYAGLDDAALAATVTADLQAVNGDKHLRLLHHAEPLADRHEDEQVQLQQMRHWANATCGGIAAAQRLDGNVGLLKVEPLIFPASVAGEAYAAAMTLLSTTDALLIDLRECLGGEPTMVASFLSYLFGDEPVELSGVFERKTNRVRQSWTSPYVTGRKFGPEKPVYVLTSSMTFSGGEAVVYDLKATGRATIVGETTRGGANPRQAYRITDHLEATITVGRSVSPVTGGNWEATGIDPDIAVDAVQALDTAHRLATSRP